MKQAILAALLSAFVWPGAGQLYNREFRKGLILIGLTLLLVVSLFLGAGVEIARRLPPDLAAFDRVQARMLSEQLLQENAGFFMAFQLLMLSVWLYGMVDAYMGARDRLPPAETGDDAS